MPEKIYLTRSKNKQKNTSLYNSTENKEYLKQSKYFEFSSMFCLQIFSIFFFFFFNLKKLSSENAWEAFIKHNGSVWH
jgi:hypothetical protein